MKYLDENNNVTKEYLEYRLQQHQYTNLWLFLLVVALIFIAIFVFKSYNEIAAIHNMLNSNLIF